MLAAFASWAAGERARESASARSRERWLRQQSQEAATLHATAVDLAERQAEVSLAVAGETISGRLVGVGADAAVVSWVAGSRVAVGLTSGAGAARLGAGGRWSVVSLRHLGALWVPAGSRDPAAGEDPEDGGRRGGAWTMWDALATLASERSAVRLIVAGADPVAGELRSAGEDMVTIRAAGTASRVAHVPLAAVAAFSLATI